MNFYFLFLASELWMQSTCLHCFKICLQATEFENGVLYIHNLEIWEQNRA